MNINIQKIVLLVLTFVFSATLLKAQDCAITNPIAEAHPCTPNGIFYVDIAFDVVNPGPEGYRVVGNGQNYGNFSYDEAFITIGPLEGDGTTVWEFIIIDNVNDNCTAVTGLDPISCNEDCSITDLVVEPHECQDGSFYLDIEINAQQPGESGYFVFVDGVLFGPYDYSEPYITLGPIENNEPTIYDILVLDIDYPSCYAYTELETINCNPNPDCSIIDLEVQAGACNDDGTYQLFLQFEYEGADNEFFDVFTANGEHLGSYELANLPLEISHFPGSGQEWDYVKVCINDHPDCCKETEFPAPVCEPNTDCAIWDIIVDPAGCDGEGTYQLYLNFNHEGTSETFDIYASNGQWLGTYAYADLPLTLEGFPERPDNEYDYIKIIDSEVEGCYTEWEFMGPDCGADENNCEIFDLEVQAGACNEDGTYELFLWFNYEAPSDDHFDVINENGEYVAYYALEDLPVEIPNFPSNGQEWGYVKVCINDNPDCCYEVEFPAPICEPNNNCEIWDIVVDPAGCDGEGTYQLYLNFNHAGTSETFDIYASNGQWLGTYAYADLTLTLEGFPERPNNEYDYIKIIDSEVEGCYTEWEFMGPDCGADENNCEIWDIVVDPAGCDGEGTYQLYLNFNHAGTSETFDIYASNGQWLGTYAYADLPLTLEGFPERPNNEYDYIKIIDSEVEGCYTEWEFMGPDCGADETNCEIWDIVVDPAGCDGEGTYQLYLNFNHAGTSDTFDIYASNGQWLGTYAYADLPLTLEGFPERPDNEHDYIKIIDSEVEGCYTEWEFMGPDCGADETACEIFELQVQTGACNEDGTYQLYLLFEYEEATNDHFDVIDAEGEVIGYFPLADLPVMIEHFQPSGSDYDYVKVCINDNPDCCKEIEFLAADCSEGECLIYDVVAEATECEEDGQFYVDLHFHFENVGEEGYTVTGNGENYGSFSYDEQIITLGPFEGDGETAYEFIITDNQNPNCTDYAEIEPVDCIPGAVWPGDANTDNTAQHFDLLNIGIAFGFQGPDRSEISTEWTAFQAEDWEQSFSDGVNYKHADCNGDGVIDAEDKEAILENFGLEHGNPVDFEPLPSTDLDPPIFVDVPEPGDLENGQNFQIPVVLGTEEDPVNDIYGIAFTIEFDPEFIDPTSLDIIFPPSWFGEENVNLITLDKKLEEEGKLYIAISRTDQNNVSGYGQIAMLIGIVDDIAGVYETELGIADIQGLSHDQDQMTFRAPTEVLSLDYPETVGRIDLRRNLRIYPNPTSDIIEVTTKYNFPIQELAVLNARGAQLLSAQKGEDRISLKDLPGGIYILRVKIMDEVFHEKIVKI